MAILLVVATLFAVGGCSSSKPAAPSASDVTALESLVAPLYPDWTIEHAYPFLYMSDSGAPAVPEVVLVLKWRGGKDFRIQRTFHGTDARGWKSELRTEDFPFQDRRLTPGFIDEFKRAHREAGVVVTWGPMTRSEIQSAGLDGTYASVSFLPVGELAATGGRGPVKVASEEWYAQWNVGGIVWEDMGSGIPGPGPKPQPQHVRTVPNKRFDPTPERIMLTPDAHERGSSATRWADD